MANQIYAFRKTTKNQKQWFHGFVQIDRYTPELIEEYVEDGLLIKRHASGRAIGLPQQATVRGYEGKL